MDAPSSTATKAAILPRMGQFDLMTRILGCESDAARAELIDVAARTMSRARAGEPVGGQFVANTIATLRAHERALAARNLRPTFDALFEVVVVPVGAVGEVTE